MQNNIGGSDYEFKGYQLISGGTNYNDKLGQIPIEAKYRFIYFNSITGKKSFATDWGLRINRRNNMFDEFYRKYKVPYSIHEVSLLTFVVSQEHYSKPSNFLSNITRKFKRKNIQRLGYIWARDIGEEVFERHYHVIIACEKISKEQFKIIFKNKNGNHYNVQFIKKTNGMRNYLKVKGLFGGGRLRAYGKSRQFLLPENKQIK